MIVLLEYIARQGHETWVQRKLKTLYTATSKRILNVSFTTVSEYQTLMNIRANQTFVAALIQSLIKLQILSV